MSIYHDPTYDPLFGNVPSNNDLHCRQQLSAMMDGCLAPDQARFLLRRLQHDRPLGQCWERWQVYGDLMRGHAHALLPPDFAYRVAAALEAKHAPTHSVVADSRRRVLRWGGGTALAASIVIAAFFAGRQFGSDSPSMLASQPADTALMASAARAPIAVKHIAPVTDRTLPDRPISTTAPAAAMVALAAVAQAPRRVALRQAPSRKTSRASLTQSSMDRDALQVASVQPLSISPDPAQAFASMPASDVALPTRAWPRPLLENASGVALTVDYGRMRVDHMADSPEFPAPFQPRLQQATDRHGVSASDSASPPR